VEISYTEYPDETCRREQKLGVKRRGQVWSDGPSVGTKWVIPIASPGSTVPLFVLVHMKGITRGVPHNYSVRPEASDFE